MTWLAPTATSAVFRYGGMPPDVAERSMRLFATEVMPELKAWAPAADRLEHLRA